MSFRPWKMLVNNTVSGWVSDLRSFPSKYQQITEAPFNFVMSFKKIEFPISNICGKGPYSAWLPFSQYFMIDILIINETASNSFTIIVRSSAVREMSIIRDEI